MSEESWREATVFLGLGANLGNRCQNIIKALRLLSAEVPVEQVSSFYETEPRDYLDQPRFLNAVCRGTTLLSPEKLLALAKEIEVALGRVPSFSNAPRPIDIDILFYGNQIISSPQLTVPHPRLAERDFVLVPLAEIAPELVHPISGKTIKELRERIGETNCVKMESSGVSIARCLTFRDGEVS